VIHYLIQQPDTDVDEYGTPLIEESSTPFEPELKVEDSLHDIARAQHSETHPGIFIFFV
jgi:hypothetical protein